MYCAIFTSPWCSSPDESFSSEELDEAMQFIMQRASARGYNQAYIIKCENEKEEIIVSLRTVK